MSIITRDLGQNTAPRYRHSGCLACIFLGHEGAHDLYVCLRENTVIARYGDDGQYTSGMVAAHGQEPLLVEARRRAQTRGLLQYDVRQAVRYTPADAGESLRLELADAIGASPAGRALKLLETDAKEGARQLAVLTEAEALQWQAQFQDHELSELRGWYRDYLMSMYGWMVRLGMIDARAGLVLIPDEGQRVGLQATT